MSMMPIVDGLEAEFEGQVAVVRLNGNEEENREIQSRHNLFGHPAFALVTESGEVAASFFGPQDAETLRQAMAAIGRE